MTLAAYEAAAARAGAEGRREQRCPNCGREEAGGSYCTACSRPMHPDDWTNDTARSRSGRTAAHARRAPASAPRSATGAKPEKGYPTTTTTTAAA